MRGRRADEATGATELPSVATNLSLKYVAVGHGIQNYTCASANATAVNVGALAVLYDATALYPGTGANSLSTDSFDNLTSTILWEQTIPLNLVYPEAIGPAITAAGKVAETYPESYYQAVIADPFIYPTTDLSLPSAGVSAPYLGHHYFDSLSSPTFNLSASPDGLILSAAKIGDVKAPTTSDKGLLATGAVDWLELGDSGRGLSNGLSNVYRVVTAGGSAQACSVSGVNTAGEVFSVPYVAQYWFYG